MKSESKFLERSRIALTNAESNPEIKTALATMGFDEAKYAEGWQVYNNAKERWELNKQEQTETRVVANSYHAAYSGLEMKFKRHRDLALILFKKDPDALLQLGVKGRFPTRYNDFFDKCKLFYTVINSNTEMQPRLSLIKLTPELATSCLAELDTLLAHRAEFDREMGESQVSTVSKNAALYELSEWMDEFDILSRIALYDTPQHLEVLGMLVRS